MRPTAAVAAPAPAPVDPGGRRPGGRARHVAGIDGLRGVAVLAVLGFHGGVSWLGGGFLGVSLFFTLSGFLIAALLDGERRRTGGVDLRGFWVRRARRLLPAALVVIAATWVLASVVPLGTTDAGDAVAAALYVANWNEVVGGGSYAELFAAPSPYLHYWSLAIEEQFYVVVGVAAAVAARRGRGLAPVAAGLLVGALAYVAVRGGGQTTYYDTVVRAPELLIGVLGGVAVGGAVLARRVPAPVAQAARWGCVPLLAGWAALVATTDTTTWTQRPLLFAALGVVNLGVVVAAGTQGTVAHRALSAAPLVALGRLSYVLYLVHWPVFLWLGPERTGLDGAALLLVRLAVSVAVAVAVRRLVELPFQRLLDRPALVLFAVVDATVLVLALVAVVSPATTPGDDLEVAQAEIAALISDADADADGAGATAPTTTPSTSPVPAAPTVTVPPPPPPLVSPSREGRPVADGTPAMALLGDSSALMSGVGLARWGVDTGQLRLVAGVLDFECGLVDEGLVRYAGDERPIRAECDWRSRWLSSLQGAPDADVAVVQTGPFDVADRLLPGDDTWRAPGDPVYDEYVQRQVRDVLALTRSAGVQLVWIDSPHQVVGRNLEPWPGPLPESSPARMDRYNELIDEVLAGEPGVARVGLREILAGLPGGELSLELRPDGVHLTDEASDVVAERLGPAVVAAIESARTSARPVAAGGQG